MFWEGAFLGVSSVQENKENIPKTHQEHCADEDAPRSNLLYGARARKEYEVELICKKNACFLTKAAW